MNLEILDKIKPVEAPPFLFTRIQQRIKNANEHFVSNKIVWLSALSFSCLVIISVSVIFYTSSPSSTAQSLAQSLHLNPTNNLY